jgi:hypothetical protein
MTRATPHNPHRLQGWLFLAALFSSCGLWAAEKACLMEGRISFNGVTTEIKDCMLNNGIPDAQFKEACQQLAQATAAVPGNAPGTVAFMAACPSGAQGQCQSLMGQPLTAYYYKRPVADLPQVKQGCEAMGGTWK